jgi:uncharacterized membrane protein YccC
VEEASKQAVDEQLARNRQLSEIVADTFRHYDEMIAQLEEATARINQQSRKRESDATE